MLQRSALLLTLALGLPAVEVIASGSIAGASVTASTVQHARTDALNDGAGLNEEPVGSGVFVHTNAKYAQGGTMWSSEQQKPIDQQWVSFDLGAARGISAVLVWNYNESGWTARGMKQCTIAVSNDGKDWRPAGVFTLKEGSGGASEPAQSLVLTAGTRGRHVRISAVNSYGQDAVGLSEVRFVVDNATGAAVLRGAHAFVQRYPRTSYTVKPGEIVAGCRNITFPADSGVVDVSKAPYKVIGDGITDCTAALNQAFTDHPNQGAIIYLPNGVYVVSDTVRWGAGSDGGNAFKNTILHGQSRLGTIIRLKDESPGFSDATKAKPLIWTGDKPAQRFANGIHHLTVDSGRGNPGCSAVQFNSSNQGTVSQVTIVAGDGRGVAGLDLGFTDEVGPLLIKDVLVQGFDIGIRTGGSVNSQVLEDVQVRWQNQVGCMLEGQPLSIHRFTSINEVQAITARGSSLVLIDATCTGSGEAAKQSAINVPNGVLYAEQLKQTGYARILEAPSGKKVDGATCARFTTLTAVPVGNGKAITPLDPPLAPETNPTTWTSPLAFGGKPGSGSDETDQSAALQQAFDAGKDTVYLPNGCWRTAKTITIPPGVKRVVGCRSFVWGTKGFAGPMFTIADGPEPLHLERIAGWWGNDQTYRSGTRTLVIREQTNVSGEFGAGRIFIEDLATNPGGHLIFNGSEVYGRQINAESQDYKIINNGGRVWILGYKTERGGPLLETTKGGRSEIWGGFSYTTTDGSRSPMFVVKDGSMAGFFGEVCYGGDPFKTILSLDGKEIGRADPRFRDGILLGQ